MNYYLIIRPLIGAGIGYITNLIAVRMLFRPLNPIKIGSLTLPFTPGIIPKNKERLAISIGDAISNNLLTEEALKDTLLSCEKKAEIRDNISAKLNKYAEESTENVQDMILKVTTSEQLENLEKSINSNLSQSIFASIKEANLGQVVAEQIMLAASEKMKGSLLGLFGGKAMVSSFEPEIALKVNEYIDNNGEIIISSLISQELDKIEEKRISEIVNNPNIDITTFVMDIYEKIVINKLPSLLNAINISKIVSEKINSMPTLELEKLILEIMKKELNALVNLGALIGFVLGLLNLLF